MRKVLPPLFVTFFFFMIPMVIAEPSLSIELGPEPHYNQVWAYETYRVNLSIRDFNLSQIDFSGYNGSPSALQFEGNVRWRVKGGYDFGTATTGYNYELDGLSLTQTTNFEFGFSAFNLTFEKDTYSYGRLPFETLEINFRFDVFVKMSDESQGPKIASKSHTYILMDEMKVSYIEGKYLDMKEEIITVLEVSGLTSLNRERYLKILDLMNSSLAHGDYLEAFDIWDDYDEGYRIDLIKGLVRASDVQYAELESLQPLEAQLQETESSLSILKDEYEQLENTYFTLANTYRKVNTELDVSKRNLSTAITAVFLTGIVFYFLGRRGID